MIITNPLLARLLQLSLSALALIITAYLLPGMRVSGFLSALLAAFVIGLANSILRPILLILTLPINILTLGLFTLVVNGLVLRICAAFVPGFDFTGLGTAILAALLLSFVNMFLNYLLF